MSARAGWALALADLDLILAIVIDTLLVLNH